MASHVPRPREPSMDALEAIRRRRSVRRYTDRPVSATDVDRLLRLALMAPSESMAQAWSFVVVRNRREELADLVVRGGGEYFRIMREPVGGVDEDEHAAWARGYAEQVVGGVRHAPVWIVPVLVPRRTIPEPHRERLAAREAAAEMMSLAFALENLLVAARAMDLGTLPTNFHGFYESEFRAWLALPAEVSAPIITPLGYPVEFPTSLPPALAAARRPWRSLVHDETWGAPRSRTPATHA
ncbi:MAG: nitroreductase family protein [Thermoleophilia bacterium]